MPILFDHDKVTGITQHFDYDPITDMIHLTSSQDVTAILDDIQQKRNDPEAWAKGVKKEWAHYATIPTIVEMELKKKGIDIYNPNQTKELLKEINTNYQYLKATIAKNE